MVEVQGMEVPIEVQMADFNRRMDEIERRLEKTKKKAQESGKGVGSAFTGGMVAAAVGFVAGAASNNPAVNSVLDLLVNIMAAAILPVIVALLPILEELLPAILAMSEAIARLIAFLRGKIGDIADNLVLPLSDDDRNRLVLQVGGANAFAPGDGTELVAPSGRFRTTEREETIPIPLGIGGSLQVNREKIWGPDIIS